MDLEMTLESDEEMTRRDAVLLEVRNIFIQWVHFISTEVKYKQFIFFANKNYLIDITYA